jgi:hypothetical protein
MFLTSIFGTRAGDAWIEWGHFAPHLVIDHRGRLAGNVGSPPDDRAVYYCAGMIKPGGTRCNADIERVHVLTIDDVGTKIDRDMMEMAAPAPTFVIETSAGNHQWQYAIDGGMDPEVYVALRASMKANAIWGHSEAIAPSNLVRLPVGVNGKSGVAHDVRLVEQSDSWVGDDLIGAFGGLTVSVAQLTRMAAGLRAPTVGQVGEILTVLPNDGVSPYCADYQAWITFGLALYGATAGEGLDLWEDWCGAQVQGVDPVEKWGTFSGTGLGWDSLVMWANKYAGDRGALAGALFNDGVVPPVDNSGDNSGDNLVVDLDEAEMEDSVKLPRRAWLYGRRLIRGYLSSTIAAGGTGKSSLTMVEAVSMATGRDLLGVGGDRMPREPLRVLIWNGEDPMSELRLRLSAVGRHHGVTNAELGGRLFMLSGREKALRLGGSHHKADLAWIRAVVKQKGIDVVMIDPFVSSHRVSENDNMAIDMIAKAWSAIAEECSCAVDLVHHIRKPGNGTGGVDLTVDDARGASALVNASRNARVLSPMPDKVAKECGIGNRRAYFAIQHDATKANMVPGMVGSDWYHFASVDMGNDDPFPVDGLGPIAADNVGVVEKHTLSLPIAEVEENISICQDEIAKKDHRMSPQSPDWVGIPIAGVLGLEPKGDRRIIENIIKNWLRDGWLVAVEKVDKTRHAKEYIEVGTRAAPDVF